MVNASSETSEPYYPYLILVLERVWFAPWAPCLEIFSAWRRPGEVTFSRACPLASMRLVHPGMVRQASRAAVLLCHLAIKKNLK